MRMFLTKLSLFLLPIFTVAFVTTTILTYIGEGYTTFNYKKLEKNQAILGSIYNEQVYQEYKMHTLATQPKFEVLALGSSRVMQFRKEMFTASFFNAGYVILNIFDFLPFLKKIPTSKRPHYLIIGLDQWMFNSKWDAYSDGNNREKFGRVDNSLKRILHQFVLFTQDVINKKYSIPFIVKNKSPRYVGLNAIYNKSGIRSDGSFFYGKQTDDLLAGNSEARDFGYASTFNRINDGNKRFEYGDEVGPEALRELDDFLNFCKNNNITVIGFLPPFADAVYKKMEEVGTYNYVSQIYPAIQPIFKKYQFEVYDFSKVSMVGSNDLETIDGFHGSDTTYQKILIEILKNKSILNKVADLHTLIIDLQKKKNRYLVYP